MDGIGISMEIVIPKAIPLCKSKFKYQCYAKYKIYFHNTNTRKIYLKNSSRYLRGLQAVTRL